MKLKILPKTSKRYYNKSRQGTKIILIGTRNK